MTFLAVYTYMNHTFNDCKAFWANYPCLFSLALSLIEVGHVLDIVDDVVSHYIPTTHHNMSISTLRVIEFIARNARLSRTSFLYLKPFTFSYLTNK